MPGPPLRQRLQGSLDGAGQFSGVNTCVSVFITHSFILSGRSQAVTPVTHTCDRQTPRVPGDGSHGNPVPSPSSLRLEVVRLQPCPGGRLSWPM